MAVRRRCGGVPGGGASGGRRDQCRLGERESSGDVRGKVGSERGAGRRECHALESRLRPGRRWAAVLLAREDFGILIGPRGASREREVGLGGEGVSRGDGGGRRRRQCQGMRCRGGRGGGGGGACGAMDAGAECGHQGGHSGGLGEESEQGVVGPRRV